MKNAYINRVACLVTLFHLLPLLVFAQKKPTTATPLTIADRLPPGTEVVMQTADAIQATHLEPGQSVSLKCRENVTLDGKVAISAGATGKGMVKTVRKASDSQVPAIEIEATEVLARDGSIIRLNEGISTFEGVAASEDFLEVGEGALFFAKSVGQAPVEDVDGAPEVHLTETDATETPIPATADTLFAEVQPETPVAEMQEPAPPVMEAPELPKTSVPIKSSSGGNTQPEEEEEEDEPKDEAPDTLPAGAEITLEIVDELVPGKAKEGQVIRMRVVDEVEIEGQIFFKEHSRAEGRIKHIYASSIYIEATWAQAANSLSVGLESLSLKIEYDPETKDDMLQLEDELTATTKEAVRIVK